MSFLNIKRGKNIEISHAVGACCRKGSIMLKMKEGERMDECIDGLAYLLIAKSEVILSYHGKDKKSKKIQKKTLLPPLHKIKKDRVSKNTDIKFARTFREEYKRNLPHVCKI